jgi:hypothetical protein
MCQGEKPTKTHRLNLEDPNIIIEFEIISSIRFSWGCPMYGDSLVRDRPVEREGRPVTADMVVL